MFIQVIPHDQMERLYENYGSSNKHIAVLSGVSHMDCWLKNGGRYGQGVYWSSWEEFLGRDNTSIEKGQS